MRWASQYSSPLHYVFITLRIHSSHLSSSGSSYTTPTGHTPAWASRVQWHAASAFDPPSYSSLIASSTAVVHTLGILLEAEGYKRSIREGDMFGLAKAMLDGGPGRLRSSKENHRSYEGMNRDSGEFTCLTMSMIDRHDCSSRADWVALTVLDTMLASPLEAGPSRPFVYISAADCFRPLIPARYIQTKREAERRIAQSASEHPTANIRPVFVRPGEDTMSRLPLTAGLMYHPHVRPISTLPAFALSMTASLHDSLRLSNPFASKSPLHGALEAFRTHPLHVDHVAEAVVRSILDEDVRGVVDVELMRRWAGFETAGPQVDTAASA